MIFVDQLVKFLLGVLRDNPDMTDRELWETVGSAKYNQELWLLLVEKARAVLKAEQLIPQPKPHRL